MVIVYTNNSMVVRELVKSVLFTTVANKKKTYKKKKLEYIRIYQTKVVMISKMKTKEY